MWDLDSLVFNNNQRALYSMMRGYAVEEVRSPLPSAWPFAIMADKLAIRLPLLTAIMTCLEDSETVMEFTALCRMLLPEYETDILSEAKSRRVYRFCYLYGKKYYPLPANTQCGIGDLLQGMPVELMGMSYTAYHELDMMPAYLLLLSLVVYPYEGDERDSEDDNVPFDPFDPLGSRGWKPSRDDVRWVKDLVAQLADGGQWIAPMGFTITKIDNQNLEIRQADNTPEVQETVRRTVLIAQKVGITVKVKVGRTGEEKQVVGARIPLLDTVKNIVGQDLASRIPPQGWHPDELHKLTNGTPYEGVGEFADWVCAKTGCIVLDSNYEHCAYEEGMAEPIFRWTQYNVTTLTTQWSKVVEIRTKIDHIVEWLEADKINRFEELMGFLLKHPLGVPSKHFNYEQGEYYCELDQAEGEDDNDF